MKSFFNVTENEGDRQPLEHDKHNFSATQRLII